MDKERPYDIGPNEGIILESEGVKDESKRFGDYSDDLVLTHERIIHVVKSSFGRVKDVWEIPLSGIKVVKGDVQVRPGDNASIEIHLKDGSTENYSFQQDKEAVRWVDAITLVLTGHHAPCAEEDEDDSVLGQFASAFKNAAGSIAAALGGNSNDRSADEKAEYELKALEAAALAAEDEPEPEPAEMVTVRCIGCRALITGEKGQKVTCSYCDTEQVL